MFFTLGPERYSAPPVETWMMPSDAASANPWSAALRVCEDDTLIAGKANWSALGGVEHLGVGLGGRDGHLFCLLRVGVYGVARPL